MGNITFSEIMEFYPKHNESVYKELKDACQGGCIIPFVGAGLSVFCGYKQWPDVLTLLVEFIRDGSLRSDIETKIKNGKLLQAAQDIQNNYPRMSKELAKIIDYDKIKKCDNDRLYASAVYALPYLFKNSFIMTTNFDRVLEEVYDRCHAKFGNVITPYEPDLLTQARQGNPHCLFKLHGDIGPEIRDINRLVFSQGQYDKAYADNSPLMQELPQWFQNKKLLFLGCSLEKDRTMEVLQQVMARNPGLDHYAILACKPEDVQKRCIEMGDLGISAIYYPDGEYEAVRVILERLLEDIDYTAYEKLNHHARKVTPIPKTAHRFMYDSDYTAFVGREKELEELQEFCKDSRQISWWAVTGPGGMGKSRLVYEFTNKQKESGWEVIWLKQNDYRDRINLKLPTKRCIVVADDVQAHLQSIGNWIVFVSERLRSEKLRILLLERGGKDLDSAKWAEMMQSDFPYDDTISLKCYCSDFLNLNPLSDEELKAIMMDFAEASGKPMADSGYADSLLQTLKEIDRDLHRPIYALAITDAWCDGKDPVCWNKEQVLDALIKRELKFYFDRLCNLSTDKISEGVRFELENLLARSCMNAILPMADIVDDEYPKLCKRADRLDMTFCELLRKIGVLYKIMLRPIDESKKQLESKEIEAVFLDCPDLVKEYLVLRQAFDRGQADLLFPENWDNNPGQLFFFGRILYDYPEKLKENSWLWTTLFAGIPKSEESVRMYSSLLFDITKKIPEIKKQALERLENLCDQHQINENIAYMYAKGLLNLTIDQKVEDCAESVEKLKILHEKLPESEKLTVEYAKGLFNLALEQKLENCIESVEKLGELHREYPESEEVAVAYANGLISLTVEQEQEECIYSVDKLRILYGEFLESEELAWRYANGLFNLSVVQKQEERVQSVEKIRALHGKFPESKDLAAGYAKGLVNLTKEQKLENVIGSVDELRKLHGEYPESEKVTVEYANGLYNLTVEQKLEDIVESVEKLRELHEEHPESEEVALRYAGGLFNLSTKQKLGEFVHNIEKLKELYGEYPKSEELAVVYANSLVNLSFKQNRTVDIQKNIKQSKGLFMQYPQNTDIQLSYAETQFNLTLKQESEALCKTVGQLCEFLSTHSEANQKFQAALDIYLSEHPEHIKRYAPLKL